MSNIYYDPEKFGLEIVGEVEFSTGCYEFDTSVLWRDKTSGAFYVGSDSGCSCPTPFESVGRDDLLRVEKLQELIDYFDQRKKDSYRYESDYAGTDVAEIDGAVGELISKYQNRL